MYKLVNSKGETYKRHGVEMHFQTIELASEWADGQNIREEFPIITHISSIFRFNIGANSKVWTSPSGATH